MLSLENPDLHKIANLFPMMSESEYQDLKSDIEKHGLHTEIVTWRGQVIDGRHRIRALTELGMDWRRDAVEMDSDGDPVAYAVGCNLKRRHLSTQQRAEIAAKISNMGVGTNQHKKKEGPPNGGGSKNVSTKEAAKLLNVSPRSVERAKAKTKPAKTKPVSSEIKPKAVSIDDDPEDDGYDDLGEPPRDLIDMFVDMKQLIREAMHEVPESQRANMWKQVIDQLADEPFAGSKTEIVSTLVQKLSREELNAVAKSIDARLNEFGVKTLFPDIHEEKRLVGRLKPTEQEFEAFYAAFPRRVNKAKSREAFEKAFVRLRKQYTVEESIAVVMRGVAAYAKHADQDALCHPTTWLNGSRWEDDPKSIGRGKTSGNKARSDYGVFVPKEGDEDDGADVVQRW